MRVLTKSNTCISSKILLLKTISLRNSHKVQRIAKNNIRQTSPLVFLCHNSFYEMKTFLTDSVATHWIPHHWQQAVHSFHATWQCKNRWLTNSRTILQNVQRLFSKLNKFLLTNSILIATLSLKTCQQKSSIFGGTILPKLS